MPVAHRKLVRFLLPAIMLLVLLSSFATVNALAVQRKAAYRAVFPYQGSARVMAFDQTGMWTVRDIPNLATGTIEHGAADVAIAPRWSPDGQTVYLTLHLSADPDSPTMLAAYTPATNLLLPLLTQSQVVGCFGTSGAFTLESISPDGHYGLLCTDSDLADAIVDLHTGQLAVKDIIDPADPSEGSTGDCYDSIFAWLLQDHRILIDKWCGLMNGWSTLITINTDGWQTIQSVPFPERHYLDSPSIVDGPYRYLLATVWSVPADDSSIIRVHPENGQVDTLFSGTALSVAPDRIHASFFDPQGHLMRLDLKTLKTKDSGVIAAQCSPYSVAATSTRPTFNYFCTDPYPSTHASFVTMTTTSASVTPIFTGDVANDLFQSGTDFYWATVDRTNQSVTVHNLQGFSWSSQTAYPGSTVSLDSFLVIEWVFYPWFELSLIRASETAPTELAHNVATGETVFAPQPNLHLSSMSVDGTWWIYSKDSADQKTEQIFAYNRTTKALTLLTEGSAMSIGSNPFDRSGTFFIWSN